MITGKDVYDVIAATMPLYVAMFLAYGSVRWWGVFSPDQCSGINRFVAVFAVPLLSFHFISSNDPYAMNYHFLAADSLQKIVILFSLFLWHSFSPRLLRGTRWAHHTTSLDWTITLFSLSTLPNTLVMGIPLLRAMYGDFSADLMVQIVVLQSVIWNTLLLFLFEYRAAKSLIRDQFPGVGASIASFRVDSDVVSLAAGDGPLDAEAEVGEDGKLHVMVRRSNPGSRTGSFVHGRSYAATPRTSNHTGVEIYSLHSSSSRDRGSSFNQADFFAAMSGELPCGRTANASPWNGPTGDEETGKGQHKGPGSKSIDFANCTGALPQSSSSSAAAAGAFPQPNPMVSTPAKAAKEGGAGKELHMFVWSSSASPSSESNMRQAVHRAASVDFASVDPSKFVYQRDLAASKALHASDDNPSPTEKAAALMVNGGVHVTEAEEGAKSNGRCASINKKKVITADVGGETVLGDKERMPPTKVMTRLTVIMVWRKLIRNPNTYASLFGILWSFISFRLHIKMPSIVHGSITILSDAGLGMAMFSLGLFMALQPKVIACGNSVAAFSMAVRFLTGPAVIAATSIAIGIRGVLLHVAIVQAALPQGIVPFVFSKEYGCYPDILSTAVIFGMLIALPITILYYVLLGV